MASRGVNKVILLGHICQDPEVRYMPNGNAVANFSIATSESWKDQQGQPQERTEFHRLTMYKRLAEIAGEYLKKRSQVYVEGKLQTRKWQDQQGQDRYTTEIVVDNMQMLGGRSDGAQNTNGFQRGNNQGSQQAGNRHNANAAPGGSANAGNNANANTQTPPLAEPDFDYDDDIPFAPLCKQYRSMYNVY